MWLFLFFFPVILWLRDLSAAFETKDGEKRQKRHKSNKNYVFVFEADMILRRSLFLLLLSFNYLQALTEGEL